MKRAARGFLTFLLSSSFESACLVSRRPDTGQDMIPRSISDIGNDWIIATLKKIQIELADEEDIALTSFSLNTSRCSEELFECCDVTFSYSLAKSCQQNNAHFWRIKLVPSDGDLREIVLRHGLFRKELLVHQQLIPQLAEYIDKGKPLFGKLPQ